MSFQPCDVQPTVSVARHMVRYARHQVRLVHNLSRVHGGRTLDVGEKALQDGNFLLLL